MYFVLYLFPSSGVFITLIYSARDIQRISEVILQFSQRVFCYFVANKMKYERERETLNV